MMMIKTLRIGFCLLFWILTCSGVRHREGVDWIKEMMENFSGAWRGECGDVESRWGGDQAT